MAISKTICLAFLFINLSLTCPADDYDYLTSASSDDFQNLIDLIKCPKTYIKLIKGDFVFKNTSTIINLNSIAEQELVIEAVLCEGVVTENCYDSKSLPKIQLGNSSAQLRISSKTSIKNVIFSHKYLFKTGCSTCDYCRFLNQTNGDFYNDRNQTMTNLEYLETSFCTKYNDLNFIFTSSELVLENVKFADFRIGYKSIIYVEAGNFIMKNVSFSNVLAAEAVILTKNILNSFINSIIYDGGLIELVNNGFEFYINSKLGSFMKLYYVLDLNFSNLEFKLNHYDGTSNFIQITNIKDSIIQNCSFHHNTIKTNLIYVSQLDISLYGTLAPFPKFIIKHSEFYKNFFTGLLYVAYDQRMQNFTIDGCSIRENIGGQAFYISTNLFDFSVKTDIIFEILLKNLIYEKNLISYCIKASNFPIIHLNYIEMTENGYEKDPNDYILNEIKTDPRVYSKLSYPWTANLIELTSLYIRKIDSLIMENISFKFNQGCLLFADLISQNFMSNIISDSNYAISKNLFYFYLIYSSYINQLFLTNTLNSNENFYLMAFGTYLNFNYFIFNNSRIVNCSRLMDLELRKKISFENLTIINSPNSLNSQIKIKFKDVSSFELLNSNFDKNLVPIFWLSSDSSLLEIDFQMKDSTFTDSKSTSSLFVIETSIRLSSSSQILRCNYYNITGNSLWISSVLGKLLMSDLEFIDHYGNSATVYILTSTIIYIRNSTFVNTSNEALDYFSLSPKSYLITENCNFTYITTLVIKITSSVYIDYGSTFMYNSETILSANQYGNVTLVNSQIIENSRNNDNHLFYFIYYSNLTILNSTIKNNYLSKSSVIFIEAGSMISIDITLFYNNTGYRGSILFIQHSNTYTSFINNSKISNNLALLTDTIFLLQGKLHIENSEFIENEAESSVAIHGTYESLLSIKNSKFIGHVGDTACVKIGDQSYAFIESCEIYDSSSEDYGVMFKAADSYLSLKGCKIKNIKLLFGNLILASES